MTDLAVTRADAPTSATSPPTAAELAARIPVPVRLPPRYDGEPMRHLSNSSYTKFLLCPEDWRRHYLKGERTAPSGAMFLGGRVDDALTTYYRHIIEQGDTLSLDQIKDAYGDQWARQLETERAKRGVDWGPELTSTQAFKMGLAALEMTFAELVPRIGRPVAVQRKVEFSLAPGLRWTIQCYLDLETLRQDEHNGQLAAAIVDYKVKGSLISQEKANHDPQAGLYLAGRWLEGQPARDFSFAQIAKPGKKRKQMGASFVTTTRTPATRQPHPDRAGRQPDHRVLWALRPRPALGVRRPRRLEMRTALLRSPRRLPRRRRPVAGPRRPDPIPTGQGPADVYRGPQAARIRRTQADEYPATWSRSPCVPARCDVEALGRAHPRRVVPRRDPVGELDAGPHHRERSARLPARGGRDLVERTCQPPGRAARARTHVRPARARRCRPAFRRPPVKRRRGGAGGADMTSQAAGNGGARPAIVLGLPQNGKPARYVRHIAVGRWTLCGVALASATVPDPPALDEPDAVQDCGHFLCQRFRAEVVV